MVEPVPDETEAEINNIFILLGAGVRRHPGRT